MVAALFKIGERVRRRTGISDARAGTVGTIQFVYRSVHDLYEVQFDGDAHPELMRALELERADRELSV
jgi:hypothetical protein